MDKALENMDLVTIINEMFLGYIERKNTGQLYNADRDIPKRLIGLYYKLDPEDRKLDEITSNFINHYIECESILENTHARYEKRGLRAMYDYIHSDDSDYRFDIYTLLELHRKLFSKAPYPEVGGLIRNADAHLDGVAIDLVPYYEIRMQLNNLDDELFQILQLSKELIEDNSKIFDYIERCVKLKCKLIKIHPFFDGNGRSVRGFINKLFLKAGLPSIYITADENSQYKEAMSKAIGEEEDYSSILQFYYYKICDSIFELDIKPRIYGEEPFVENMLIFTNEQRERIEASGFNDYDWNHMICRQLAMYLGKQGVNCDIYTTSQLDDEIYSHNFIVIYYKEKGVDKRLLMDPMFSSMFKGHEIVIGDKSTKYLYDNLMSQGMSTVTHVYQYISLFSGLSISNDRSIVLRPDLQKSITLYKRD